MSGRVAPKKDATKDGELPRVRVLGLVDQGDLITLGEPLRQAVGLDCVVRILPMQRVMEGSDESILGDGTMPVYRLPSLDATMPLSAVPANGSMMWPLGGQNHLKHSSQSS